MAGVAAILEAKCANCHTTEPKLPFYAALPGAHEIIVSDMQAGLREFDLVAALYPSGKGPATEPALAKIEYVMHNRTMPPTRYVVLHWSDRLSDADRAALTSWIRETRVAHYAPVGIPADLQAAAVHPLPQRVEVDARKAELGRQLYNDTRLSGDNTLSCASCHALDKGATDNAKVSTGIASSTESANS